MKNNTMPRTIFIALALMILLSSSPSPALCHPSKPSDTSQRSTYIVHALPPEELASANPSVLKSWHESFLPPDTTSTSQFLYSYTHSYTGFAAKLTKEEAKAMESKPGFVSAIPDTIYPLLTTHTPHFLGLNIGSGTWNSSNLGKDVIIGILDTGVFASHVSFHDDGLPIPPSKWKGTCDLGSSACNNKLIGAQAFQSGDAEATATDEVGHGTHTASTAAGNFVNGASFYGIGNGTAMGIAPLAHLAIYKVCNRRGCSSADILAGMDAALKDGVDIISLSLGGPPQSYAADPIAVGAFRAIAKGVVVSAAEGNDGPSAKTVSNVAPWMLTVAASTNDRRFMATVRLGNGVEFDGETLYHPDNFTSEPLPLVFINEHIDSQQCGSLSAGAATGMVVLCDSAGGNLINKGHVVLEAGGAGMVLFNQEETGYTTMAYDYPLPSSLVSYNAGIDIKSYINSTDSPTVSLIFKGATFGSVAPETSFFSSRGPNKVSPGILKPDITGPGVNILAAWPFPQRNGTGVTPRDRPFNVISGTSMSTPHLSGVAALVKSAHPDWSPAAIKSAIITTAYVNATDKLPIKDEQHQEASIFAIGNGHVDPSKAIDPGLVYDIEASDYTGYLCGLGYSDDDLTTIAGRRVSCSDVQVVAEGELNYPTILVAFNSTDSGIITRTVTNVGRANSTYKAQIEAPNAVLVTVEPKILQFQEINEKKSFTVGVSKASGSSSGEYWKAQLYWISDDHVVRSVISEVSTV